MNSNYDYNSNINYILKHTLKTDVKNNIELQNKILDSKSFNESFKYIEDSLNFLYEKNRVLQDIITYSKTFLSNEINNNIADCKTLLQSIEEDRDLIKDKTYIKYSVPFHFGLNNINDRNNKLLNHAVVFDNKLTLSDNILNSYDISSFSIKRNTTSIYSNESSYLNTKNYRTLYIKKAINNAPIKETIVIRFNKTIKMNKLLFNLSNCSLESVFLNLENNKTCYLDINNLNHFETKYVDAISITIACSNYIVSQTNYSNSISSNNFTSIISNISTDENLLVNKNKYYYYLFGIDNILAQFVDLNTDCGFISKDIYIGEINTNEHLALYTEESVERGSIEYFIINGSETIPILPENQTKVIDEKIFYKCPTRFAIDNKYPIVIKYNNQIVNTSLYEAINSQSDGYTVSYTPSINTISSSINNTVKIKAIVRSYDITHPIFIKTIKLKRYGGNNLWTL